MSEPSKTNNNQVMVRDYHDIIAKVAAVKDCDVEKLKQLMQLQEEWEKRRASEHYNAMMSAAQAEMTSISKNEVNPVTRSRYASLAKLDEAIRPIYTKYGFAVEFDEQVDTTDSMLHLVAIVSCGSETRRRHKHIPIVTTGIAGRAAMTATHASIAAVTYGRRALLKMIFNLSEEDDDGNRAGGWQSNRAPARPEAKTAGGIGDEASQYNDRFAALIDGLHAAAAKGRQELRNYGDALNGKLAWVFPPDKELLDQTYKDLAKDLAAQGAENLAAANAERAKSN